MTYRKLRPEQIKEITKSLIYLKDKIDRCNDVATYCKSGIGVHATIEDIDYEKHFIKYPQRVKATLYLKTIRNMSIVDGRFLEFFYPVKVYPSDTKKLHIISTVKMNGINNIEFKETDWNDKAREIIEKILSEISHDGPAFTYAFPKIFDFLKNKVVDDVNRKYNCYHFDRVQENRVKNLEKLLDEILKEDNVTTVDGW